MECKQVIHIKTTTIMPTDYQFSKMFHLKFFEGKQFSWIVHCICLSSLKKFEIEIVLIHCRNILIYSGENIILKNY